MVSSERFVNAIYRNVSSSTGKKPQVAPYSGAILAMVARSANVSDANPSPKYSTNLPTTFACLRTWVTLRAKSVAVAPAFKSPTKRTPITSGIGK